MTAPPPKIVRLSKGQALVLQARLPKWTRHGEARHAAEALGYLLGVTITVEEAKR